MINENKVATKEEVAQIEKENAEKNEALSKELKKEIEENNKETSKKIESLLLTSKLLRKLHISSTQF